MDGVKSKIIHALEFGCQAPLKFYEHCSACPRSDNNCPDLIAGKEILRGKKKLVYDGEVYGEEFVHASSFSCSAPLYYFEKTRKKCGHQGRCREEGLLLALLSGKKELVYTQKTVLEFPQVKTAPEEARPQEVTAAEAVGS